MLSIVHDLQETLEIFEGISFVLVKILGESVDASVKFEDFDLDAVGELLTFEFEPLFDVSDVLCPERRHVDSHEADLIELVFFIKNVDEGDEFAELEVVVEPDVVLLGLVFDGDFLVVSSDFFA